MEADSAMKFFTHGRAAGFFKPSGDLHGKGAG